jgi:5-methylcytosine-specific restriction endonuclease McrA
VTKRRAEVLTGYEVRRISTDNGAVCYGAFRGDELLVEPEHRKETIALTLLVNRVFELHSRRVLDEHGWRCVRCGSFHPLQIHHRKFRSHGGTHRPENLEPVCWDCHHRIHRYERSQ